MSLTSSLNNAMSGLAANQAQIDLISQNVANSDSVGYTKRTLTTTATASGGVQVGNVSRAYDQLLQKQLRTENASGAYASIRSGYAQQLDQVFGQADPSVSLDGLFNSFTSAVQTLTNDPSSVTARSQVMQYAQQFAGQLNSLSDDVQSLRTNAEQQIADDVTTANAALKGLEDVSRQITNSGGAPDAALLDQRDGYIDQLSQLMDVKVSEQPNGQVSVYTNSGVSLFDGSKGVRLQFDQRTALSANAAYNADPSKTGVGQLKIITPAGGSIDVVQQGVFRSGEFKGLLDLRDQILPEAQTQLDQMASGLSQALSSYSPTATPATSGAQSGFDVDLSNLQPGNSINIAITQQPGNVQKTITVIPVQSAADLPLPLSVAAQAGSDMVIGVPIGSNVGDFVNNLQTQLGTAGVNLAVSNPSGNVLRVLGDAAATTSVGSLGATMNATTTASAGGDPAIPLFIDGATGLPAGGPFDIDGSVTGLAGRIRVNPAVVKDTSTLVLYNTSPATNQGDATRPNLILDRLTQQTRQFSAAAGLSGTNQPFTGTVASFLSGIIASQGANAAQAQSLDAGQQVVVNSLQQKFASSAGVSVDQELSNLIKMQNAYSANARIISVVQDLFDVLDRI